jgi:hypothetical protein
MMVIVYTVCLKRGSAEMGYRQVIHMSEYTKKNYCAFCLNLNEISFLKWTILVLRVIRVCMNVGWGTRSRS